MRTKILYITSIVLISILLISCNSNDYISGQNGEELNGERPLSTIESYNDYLKFIKSAKLPDDFVYYDAISKLGEFKSLVILSESRRNDYSHYLYHFIDDTGFEISLYVDTDYETKPNDNLIMSFNGNDMRKIDIDEKGTCFYYHEGVKYAYINGELLSISWYEGNIYYTISGQGGESMLSKYPSVEKTLLGQLLNSQKSTKAFADFMPQKSAHAFDNIISQTTTPNLKIDEVKPQN